MSQQPRNLTAWVGVALALAGLLGSGLSTLIQIKTDIAEIKAELKFLHGDIQVPKGH